MHRTLGFCVVMLLGLRGAQAERVAADELHLFASYVDGSPTHYVVHEQQVAIERQVGAVAEMGRATSNGPQRAVHCLRFVW